MVPSVPGYSNLKSTGMIPEWFAAQTNIEYYSKTFMPRVTNTNFTGQIMSKGDKVTIPQRPVVSSAPYAIGKLQTPTQPTRPPIEYTVNRARSINVSENLVNRDRSQINLKREYITDATNRIAIDIETEFFDSIRADAHANNQGNTAGKKSGSFALGTAASPVTITTDGASSTTEALQYLTRLTAVLGEQDAVDNSDGKKSTWVVIPWWYRYKLVNSTLKSALVMGDDRSVIRTQMIGKIDGLEVYVSNLLPITDAATATTVILAGNSDAVAHAMVFNVMREIPDPNDMAVLHQGVWVYDWKVLKPEGLVTGYAKPGTT